MSIVERELEKFHEQCIHTMDSGDLIVRLIALAKALEEHCEAMSNGTEESIFAARLDYEQFRREKMK